MERLTQQRAMTAPSPHSQAGQAMETIDGLNCAAIDHDQMLATIAGGVFAINHTIIRPFADLTQALVQLEAKLAVIEAMPDIAFIAKSVADLEEARRTNRVGIIMGAQNSLMIESDVGLLGMFKRLGFRILQPTYNEKNRFGCGSSFEGDDDTGITEAGRVWVAEMHRLGLIIDLSHCGLRTSMDFLQEAKRPVTFSHANALALCRSARNKTDELIRAAAETGGLTGVVMYSPIVRRDARPTMDDYLDHVDHLVRVAGVEHVSFASDVSEGIVEDPVEWDRSYGPNGYYPGVTAGLGSWFRYHTRHNVHYDSLSHTPRIWEGMRRRGYGASDIEKIQSGNWLRVMRDIWGG